VGLTAVASRSHRTPETDTFLANYQIHEFRSIGSSLKFCLVAAGEADIYPRIGTTMEWDTAAGHAVLRAAGGNVTGLSGEPFRYGKPGFRNGNFVARGR
jgi:3'(2'), 5'-bisphosphate nucleotidase